MLESASVQQGDYPVEKYSSVSIILVANQQSQVVDSEITQLEASEIIWLLSQIKKYGFAAVEETIVHYLIASDNHDYTL
jgi:hypothetical protein